MMGDKVMSLTNQEFEPQKVIEFIKDLFAIKANAKRVKIKFKVVKDLPIPY